MSKVEQMMFRVTPELKSDFQRAAALDDVPAAQVLREFMRAYVQSKAPGHRSPAPVSIDPAERQVRLEAISFARASMALEGFKASPEAELMQEKFINGEVSFDDCIEAVRTSLTAE